VGRSAHGLVSGDMLSQHFPGVTEEIQMKPGHHNVPDEMRAAYLPNASQKRNRLNKRNKGNNQQTNTGLTYPKKKE
jgi:hypothetical protein